MKKLQFLLIPLLIFISCEGLADMIFSEAGEEEAEEIHIFVGDTLAITHTGQSDALFDAIVADTSQITGESYTLSFDVVDSVTYWFLKNAASDVLATNMIFPATEEYYATLDSQQLQFYHITNTITDGFILSARNATFDPPMTYSSAEVVVDDFDSTAVVFGGLAHYGTWAAFIEGTPLEPKPVAPGSESLQLDIEFRFTDNGSVATYFNASVSVIDTILLPFEVWSIEEDRQINAAFYQAAGSKPVYAADPDFAGSYNFTKNFFIIPVYENYTGTGMSDYYSNTQMGWMLKFDKTNTSFESGNIFRVSFVNPLFPGVDTYTIDAAGSMATSGDDLSAQLEAVNVFPNPYFGQNPEERNQLNRFVYFTNLGVGKTTIRIFTISGDLIRVIEKSIDSENSADRRVQWDLRNSFGIPVASGMYIAHLSLGDDQNESSIGEKVMKLAVFMPEERLDVY